MSAYVISEVEMLDQGLFERYRSLAPATIAKYGGRYIVRGGAQETVEGGATSRQFVIVEFPTMEKAREWYASPEYAEALKVRQKALERRLTFVEGIAPASTD
jgi:uncharacterized protein (DUF1330 family)